MFNLRREKTLESHALELSAPNYLLRETIFS
jgi:hypothetical protein